MGGQGVRLLRTVQLGSQVAAVELSEGPIRRIIIIHLLGLAPAGYLTTPDNGPEGRLRGGASQGDGCRAVPLNLLNRV
jgi:hypothetical protein